ncbi:lysophospholipid acyltransferase family protein [Shimia biformata]|uniref:lysophospholipid acyltransferase family protein n=1 Tax=Shimia biformata TaxID=1294299 RepID=UPI00194FF5EE|nr:lauroyl acyltransferase [Shimia biformata]
MSADTPPLSTRIAHYTSNLIIVGLIRFALLIPYEKRVPMMGWLVSHVIAPIAGWRRRVRRNLAYVLPDLPKAEVERLARAVPDNAGRTLIEIYSGQEMVDRAIRAPVTGPGLAKLEAARAAGRPVILVTGHMGNYTAARAALMHRGHMMGGLYRRMSNAYFNTHYVAAMEKTGKPMFEQGRKGMVEMVRHLKGGGVLGILTDLHFGAGEKLDFFGKPAATSLVTAELALKFDAAMIPVYGLRAANGLDFEIVMQDEIAHTDPVTMTQQVNDGLEQLVRLHMDQWFWIHRRWKVDPKAA